MVKIICTRLKGLGYDEFIRLYWRRFVGGVCTTRNYKDFEGQDLSFGLGVFTLVVFWRSLYVDLWAWAQRSTIDLELWGQPSLDRTDVMVQG